MQNSRYNILRVLHNPNRALDIALKRVRALFWKHYVCKIRDPKIVVHSDYQLRFLEGREDEKDRINTDILASGIPLRDIDLKAAEFHKFVKDADYFHETKYEGYRNLYAHAIYNKIVQHYVSILLLDHTRISDYPLIYMDVGSEYSVGPDVYNKLFDWKFYRQDLSYKPGIHGVYIGGDAGNLPLPDESVHLITLHCAYEHFEGDSDVHLIKEAYRILKPKGRLVIVPLYLSDKDRIMTDPVVSVPAGIKFLDRIEVICIPRWWNRFGRLYSVQTLKNRVIDQWKNDRVWLVRFFNDKSLHKDCYISYGLVLEKNN